MIDPDEAAAIRADAKKAAEKAAADAKAADEAAKRIKRELGL